MAGLQGEAVGAFIGGHCWTRGREIRSEWTDAIYVEARGVELGHAAPAPTDLERTAAVPAGATLVRIRLQIHAGAAAGGLTRLAFAGAAGGTGLRSSA